MRRSQRQICWAMNLLLLLALAVPLGCLAFLSLLESLGVMTLGAVIHVVGIVKAHRLQWPSVEPAKSSTGDALRRAARGRDGGARPFSPSGKRELSRVLRRLLGSAQRVVL